MNNYLSFSPYYLVFVVVHYHSSNIPINNNNRNQQLLYKVIVKFDQCF